MSVGLVFIMSSPTAARAPAHALDALCPGCFTGTIHTAQPVGHLETIHDVPTYITRGTATSNSTIIFLTDLFGLNLVNNKLLADQYAARTGLRVLVPDVLPHGGAPLVLMRWSEDVALDAPWWNLVGHARRFWAGCRLMSILIPFSFKVRRLYPVVLAYVRAVRASLPLGAKLGIAGFCVGGYWSSRICAEPAREHHHPHPPSITTISTFSQRQQQQRQRQQQPRSPSRNHRTQSSSSHLVDAHFTAHPSSVGPEELAALAAHFRVPWSMALAGKDMMMSADQAHKVHASLREVYRDQPDKLQVEVYENCEHGFAVRVNPDKAYENEAAERALEQAVGWFRRYLGS